MNGFLPFTYSVTLSLWFTCLPNCDWPSSTWTSFNISHSAALNLIEPFFHNPIFEFTFEIISGSPRNTKMYFLFYLKCDIKFDSFNCSWSKSAKCNFINGKVFDYFNKFLVRNTFRHFFEKETAWWRIENLAEFIARQTCDIIDQKLSCSTMKTNNRLTYETTLISILA